MNLEKVLLINIVKKPKESLFSLRLVAIIICLVYLLKISLVIQPILLLPRILTEPELVDASFGGLQNSLGIENKFAALSMLAFGLLLSMLFVISGIFSFLRKSWARKMLISVIILQILSDFTIMILKGRFTIKFVTIEDLIIYIFLLFFFTRRGIVQLFAKEREV